MANGARFRITGSVSGAHPSSTPGATVTAGETLTLQLEDTASNILNAKYEIVEDSAAAAPALTLNPADGVPTPSATSAVTLVVPLTGPWSYKIRCTANRRYDANGTLIYDWMFERIIAIEPQGLRHILPSEVGEFDPVYTWVQAFNEMTNAVAGGPIPFEEDHGIFRPETYGAIGDVQTVTDGVTTAADATVTSATAGFTSADVGKVIRIRAAGAAGVDLRTTIAGVTNATTIELSVVAGSSVNPATIHWGTDDGEAFQDCLDAVKSAGGGIVQLSSKSYGLLRNLGLSNADGISVIGNGMGTTKVFDLREDTLVGAPTGNYYGLLSFVSCSNCFIARLSLVGAESLSDGANTAQGGRKGTHYSNSTNSTVTYVECSEFRDEAIYAQNDCPGWIVSFCNVHDNGSNGINLNAGPTTSAGCIIIGNYCADNDDSAILVACKSFVISGNYCSSASIGADLVAFDLSASGSFVGNTICDTTFTAGVCALHIFGTGDANASAVISGNTFARIDGFWVGASGAIISVDDGGFGVGYEPAGNISIVGNIITGCSGTTDASHRAVMFRNCAPTFRGYFAGNQLIGSDANWLRVGVTTTGNDAGSVVRIGDNFMSGWVTEYDCDTSVQFNNSCYVTSVEIGIGDTPYTVPVGVSRVNVDLSGGAIQCNLPPISSMLGREIQFLDVTGSCSAVNTLTIEGDGAETVNGAANVVGTTARQPITVYARSGGWVTTAPVF